MKKAALTFLVVSLFVGAFVYALRPRSSHAFARSDFNAYCAIAKAANAERGRGVDGAKIAEQSSGALAMSVSEPLRLEIQSRKLALPKDAKSEEWVKVVEDLAKEKGVTNWSCAYVL